MPQVLEAAVIGVPDRRFIEAVTAVVSIRPDTSLTAAEVIQYVRSNLARFKTPRFVVFVDSLPKNASGKILKRELRLQYQDLAIAAGS
jgi:fatty-acyl-CoA synthase